MKQQAVQDLAMDVDRTTAVTTQRRLEAPLLLWRTRAPKDSSHAEIFVDLRPMNTFAFANQLPLISFISGGVKQSRIQDQRRGYSATIDEMNRQFVIGHHNLHGARFRFNYESAHSRPLRKSGAPRLNDLLDLA
jgi:hypothetical protein